MRSSVKQTISAPMAGVQSPNDKIGADDSSIFCLGGFQGRRRDGGCSSFTGVDLMSTIIIFILLARAASASNWKSGLYFFPKYRLLNHTQYPLGCRFCLWVWKIIVGKA